MTIRVYCATGHALSAFGLLGPAARRATSWMRWPSPCVHGLSEGIEDSSIERTSRLKRPTMTLPRRLRGLPGKLLDFALPFLEATESEQV
jgi:hypothetical protein